MPFSCITIDDEPLALNLLSTYIAQTEGLTLLQAFEDALQAKCYLEQHTVDLIFLDIDMPDMNGIKLIRSLSFKPLFIFTTAYKDYAWEGFELEAVDFLLKPFDIARFQRAVDRARELQTSRAHTPHYLQVYSEYQLVRIDTSTIEYLESMQDYVKIYLSNGQCILTLSTLKGIASRLPAKLFMRIHRRYIVSFTKVHAFKNGKVSIAATQLPVGAQYLAPFKAAFTR